MSQNATEQAEHTRLNHDDQKLVDDFVTTGVNKVERESFHPWKMMLWLTLGIAILGVSARLIGTVFLPY